MTPSNKSRGCVKTPTRRGAGSRRRKSLTGGLFFRSPVFCGSEIASVRAAAGYAGRAAARPHRLEYVPIIIVKWYEMMVNPQSGFRTCSAFSLRPYPDSTSTGPCPQSPLPHGPRFPSTAPFPADEIPRMPETRHPVHWENSAPTTPRPDRASACNAGNRPRSGAGVADRKSVV